MQPPAGHYEVPMVSKVDLTELKTAEVPQIRIQLKSNISKQSHHWTSDVQTSHDAFLLEQKTTRSSTAPQTSIQLKHMLLVPTAETNFTTYSPQRPKHYQHLKYTLPKHIPARLHFTTPPPMSSLSEVQKPFTSEHQPFHRIKYQPPPRFAKVQYPLTPQTIRPNYHHHLLPVPSHSEYQRSVPQPRPQYRPLTPQQPYSSSLAQRARTGHLQPQLKKPDYRTHSLLPVAISTKANDSLPMILTPKYRSQLQERPIYRNEDRNNQKVEPMYQPEKHRLNSEVRHTYESQRYLPKSSLSALSRPGYKPRSSLTYLSPDRRLVQKPKSEYLDPSFRPEYNVKTATANVKGMFKHGTNQPYKETTHRPQHHDREEQRYRERPGPDRRYPGYSSHSLQAKDLVLHLIALNTPMSGNMRGVRGADLACYQQARQANFRTTFRAFLSSHVQDLNKVVHNGDRDTPVVNLRGERIFNSWSDIFKQQQMADVPIYSFNRRNIFSDPTWPEKHVWHGSDSTGMRSESGYCNAWRSAEASQVGRASLIDRGLPLLNSNRDAACSRKFVVLCIENMSKYNVDKRLGKKRARYNEK